MKYLLPLFAFLSVHSFAQVVLDKEEIALDKEIETLVRTADTPSVVKILQTKEQFATRCLESASEEVYGQDESCGIRMVLEEYCPAGYLSDLSDPNCFHNKYYREVPELKSCLHVETTCLKSEQFSLGFKTFDWTIDFKKLPELTSGQEETFKLELYSSVNGRIVPQKTIKKYKVLHNRNARRFELKKKFFQ